MTVIRPNGISGVTSITSSGNTINFYKSDGTLGPELGLNVNVNSGISTFAALNVTGVLTYEDVTSVDSVGIITARSDLSIADKIIHTGDTNTAIRFPAADTVTVETAGSERVRIKSDGTLHAIKTGTQITNAEQTVAVFQRSSASGTTSKISIVSGNGAASHINFGDTDDEDIGQIIYDHSNNSMQFLTNTSEKLRIDSSGKMGLGTSSPTGKLHVDAGSLAVVANFDTTGTGGGAAYFKHSGANKMIIGTAGSSALTGSSVNDGLIRTEANLIVATGGNNERLRIDSSGRILLGTVTEGHGNADDLTIAHGSNAGMTIRSGNTSQGSIYFSDATSDVGEYAGWLRYDHSANNMTIGTNSTEAIKIDSSGRLLIGTSSTATPGSVVIQGNSVGSDSYGFLRLTKGSTTPADGDTLGSVAFGDSNHNTAAFIGCERDGGTWTSGSSHPTRIVFNTASNGSSGSSERMRILSSGGITFNGDTAAANALDDYEEGTFTPTVAAGADNGSGGAPPLSIGAGRYTKIGNKVFVDIFIRFASGAYSNGVHARIGNLPFSISNLSYGGDRYTRGGGTSNFHNTTDDITTNYGTNNTTYFYLYKNGGQNFYFGGSDNTHLSGEYWIGTFEYHTDS